MKTAITVLQELMIKLGRVPEYECISQSGPHHQVTFEYRCIAQGISVTAQARSKKEAKQESARRMLLRLHAAGQPVPPPYDTQRGNELDDLSPPSPTNKPALEAGPSAAATTTLDTRSYVALLKELCEEYRLGGVEYELTGDTGPAHLRRFVMSAKLGQHVRVASATTKKAARQLAAEQLYTYLRENLGRLTMDFVEEEALSRALEKAMERYVEKRENQQWRPDLSLRVSEFHLGLLKDIDEEKRSSAIRTLERPGSMDGQQLLSDACDKLGLRMDLLTLSARPDPLVIVSLSPCTAPLAFAGRTYHDAYCAALNYLRRALHASPSA